MSTTLIVDTTDSPTPSELLYQHGLNRTLTTGTKSLVLQARDRRFLESLETMRVVDRDQAMAVAGFHSITRANTRLLRLKNAGLLRRLFIGSRAGNRKALYVLSGKGAAIAGVRLWHLNRRRVERLVVDPLIEHQLAVNSIYIQIFFGTAPTSAVRLKNWTVFPEPISVAVAIAPDGYFELELMKDCHPMFLEVDRGTEGQSLARSCSRREAFATSRNN